MKRDEEPFRGKIGRTYHDSEPAWPERVRPPPAAPNVLVILLDDVGFSDLGCYGSEIATPHMDALASRGIRYTNFNVTSMCSPTRACLLTGRNAHAVGVGIIAEYSSGFPGYQGRMTRRAATAAEILKDHGYGTYISGKWHLTNLADYGAAGPHDDWPLGRGFQRWFGFQGALMDHWNPELVEDNSPIHFNAPHGYHLSGHIVDRAVSFVRDHVTSAPDRPYFLYVPFGACHWPHHVPAEYLARYRGRYDTGWDAVRAARLEKQLALGIVPQGTALSPRNPGVDAWEDLEHHPRELAKRLQETYAAFLEHTDAEIGRLLDGLDALGALDDTAIALMSDNGASEEGGPTGAINMRTHMIYEPEDPRAGYVNRDRAGGPYSYSHYPWGWAQVSNTPLKWYKKDTHGGGIRAPLILSWPGRIPADGSLRHQYHHVIDILPTLLGQLGVTAPETYRGVDQLPLHGLDLSYTFDAPEAPTRKETQYFELLGDRAIWHRGWKAVARHDKGTDFDADRWELYHLDEDYAELHDLAGANPDKLEELVDLWWREARTYGVLPLDDRDTERAQAWLRARPSTRYTYYPGMARIDRLAAPDITDRSWRLHAEIDLPEHGAEGVLFAWGARFGGLCLYVRGGAVHFEYRFQERIAHHLHADLGSWARSVGLGFERSGDREGVYQLLVDGVVAAATQVPRTWPTYGPTAGLTCGLAGVPLSDAFTPPFAFTGTLHRVTVELDRDGEVDLANRAAAVLKEE